VVDFLLVLIELFTPALTVERYERILVNILVFERGVGHFERKFSGKGGHPPTTLGVRKTSLFQGRFVVGRLGLAMINKHTKFEVSSLSRSRDILGGLKI